MDREGYVSVKSLMALPQFKEFTHHDLLHGQPCVSCICVSVCLWLCIGGTKGALNHFTKKHVSTLNAVNQVARAVAVNAVAVNAVHWVRGQPSHRPHTPHSRPSLIHLIRK